MPSQSRRSSAADAARPVGPHTQAVAHDVVGRRTPTAESSRPVRALNVEDLPDPVAPAIATTVWSAESHSRLDARSSTAWLSSSSSSGSRPREADDRRVEALDAGADVGAPGDQLLGPLQQGRHGLPVASGRTLVGRVGRCSAKA